MLSTSIEVRDSDGEAHVGMLGAVGRRQHRDHGERGRDRGDAEMAAQARA